MVRCRRLVARAREVLPGLPVERLYEVQASIERLLSSEGLEPRDLDQLERLLETPTYQSLD